MTLVWHTHSWEEIPKDQWHDCLALRIDIFVVEQECPYSEIDGKDKKSWHLYATENDVIAAYIRIVPPGISYEEISIGRVAIAKTYRGKKLGYQLMNRGMDFIQEKFGEQPIRIGAQQHLRRYYEQLGFAKVSDMYLEDGIPHIDMLFTPTQSE